MQEPIVGYCCRFAVGGESDEVTAGRSSRSEDGNGNIASHALRNVTVRRAYDADCHCLELDTWEWQKCIDG